LVKEKFNGQNDGFCLKAPVRRICTQFYTARQARFGGILDHGHEAAVYRNENKPLAIIRQLTFVAEYLPKQYQNYNFGVWDVFSITASFWKCNSL
jgi:hypothetical protein